MDGRTAPRAAAIDTFRWSLGETSLGEWEQNNNSKDFTKELKTAKDHSYINSFINILIMWFSKQTAQILNWFAAVNFRMNEELLKPKQNFFFFFFFLAKSACLIKKIRNFWNFSKCIFLILGIQFFRKKGFFVKTDS